MLDTVVIGWCWLSMVQVSMCLFGHQYSNKKEVDEYMLDTVVIALCWLLVVQVLMCLFGADPNKPNPNTGRCALHYAMEGNHRKTVEWVLCSHFLCVSVSLYHIVCTPVTTFTRSARLHWWVFDLTVFSVCLLYISLVVYEEKIIYCVLLLFFLLFFLLIFLFVYLWKNGTEW